MMEYVEGSTLATLLSKQHPTEDKIIAWAMGLASALREVHRLGFVHRDIKPENILIDKMGVPKLIDFGFVASIQPHSQSDEVVGELSLQLTGANRNAQAGYRWPFRSLLAWCRAFRMRDGKPAFFVG